MGATVGTWGRKEHLLPVPVAAPWIGSASPPVAAHPCSRCFLLAQTLWSSSGSHIPANFLPPSGLPPCLFQGGLILSLGERSFLWSFPSLGSLFQQDSTLWSSLHILEFNNLLSEASLAWITVWFLCPDWTYTGTPPFWSLRYLQWNPKLPRMVWNCQSKKIYQFIWLEYMDRAS